MAKEAEAAPPLRVLSGEVARGEGVRSILQMVLRDHSQFKAVMVVAVIPTETPDVDDCRVYSVNLGHLEKLGLLQEASETLKNT